MNRSRTIYLLAACALVVAQGTLCEAGIFRRGHGCHRRCQPQACQESRGLPAPAPAPVTCNGKICPVYSYMTHGNMQYCSYYAQVCPSSACNWDGPCGVTSTGCTGCTGCYDLIVTAPAPATVPVNFVAFAAGRPHHVEQGTGENGLSRKLHKDEFTLEHGATATSEFSTFKYKGNDIFVQLFKVSVGGRTFHVGHETEDPGMAVKTADAAVASGHHKHVFSVTPKGSVEVYTVITKTAK